MMTTPSCRAIRKAILGILIVAGAAAAARAEEVQWRTSYNTARKEAEEKGRPLLVDFGTENCFWCKRLDATTFRDGGIVGMLNERFIPVRIDAEKDTYLTQALNIRSFPTLVFAGPDGKILGNHEGYLDVARFREQAQRVLTTLAPPEPIVRERPENPPAMAGGPPAVPAGPEVKWRSDYNSARREAQEKGWPIILEFSTENCLWCKKLEVLTLRDPAIASVLNERFVALKVNGDKDPALAQALHVQTYPTLVLAAPDGKILGTLEGYVDVNRFQEYLQRTLTSVSNPEWMARDYQEAVKAIAASDYARALALLKGVTDDKKDRPVQVKAQQLLQDLEQQATGRLARAKQHEDKGQTAEALHILSDLMRAFAGSQAATEASQLLTALGSKPEIKNQQRSRRACELLAQAREDYRTQQYLCCLERCDVLASGYADLPEGTEAMQLAAEIKNNPEWMKSAIDGLNERLSVMYLALADTCLKKGQPQQAIVCLERVVQAFPGTRHAEAATIRLSQIQGQPTRQADFKKP